MIKNQQSLIQQYDDAEKKKIDGLKKIIEKNFYEFYQTKKFIEGLDEPQIQTQFLSLLLILVFQDRIEITIYHKILSKLNQNEISIQSIDDQQRIDQITNQANQEDLIKWWNCNINEQLMFKIIVQIFIIVSNSTCKIEKFSCNFKYNVQSRNFMMEILKIINISKFGYNIIQTMQICERIAFQIELQVLSQLSLFSQNQTQFLSNQQIIIKNGTELFNIKLDTEKENKIFIYQEKNTFLFKIIKKQNYQSILNQYIQIIKNKHHLQSVPVILNFELLSNEEDCSNVITICISGFLSNKGSKKEKWKNLLCNNPGTVISLNWNCKELEDFNELLMDVKNITYSNQTTFLKIFNIANVCISQNPFQQAYEEAQLVGTYLGLLISEFNIFAGKQLNIICHSLGSNIVHKCIEQLDIYHTNFKDKFINQIIIMGGVMDIEKLKLLKWKAVQNLIINFSTENDYILKKFLTSYRFLDKPCGLYPIQGGEKILVNYDLTEKIKGHSDYFNHLEYILDQANRTIYFGQVPNERNF